MGLLFTRAQGDTTAQLVPRHGEQTGSVHVDENTSLRHSGVWAALRVRADLISSLPVDSYRNVGDLVVEVPNTQFILDPSGVGMGMSAWMWATQFDLDRYGNCFGIIRLRDAIGNPLVVQLVAAASVIVHADKQGNVDWYKVGTQKYDPLDIWHERQYWPAGSPVGLSPIMMAAASVGTYMSAQMFAADWFQSGAQPIGTMKNLATAVPTEEQAIVVKEKWKAAVRNRDMFVVGKDWEYSMAAAEANQTSFLQQMQYGIGDVARYLGVPADIIDAAVSGQSITYANITQRNLQLLILNLGPAIGRREYSLSQATPKPRFVKLNTDALLRMDPAGVTANLAAQVSSRIRTPSEARGLMDLPALTETEFHEFDRLFPPRLGAGMAPVGSFVDPILNLSEDSDNRPGGTR